jgi:TonB-dependent starch-binding outer membrane protein SusC
MRVKLILPFILFFLSTIVFGQDQIVEGRVIDALTNQPMPGATILIKGTTTGTTTDFDGNFSLATSSNDILLISYLGYLTSEVNVSSEMLIVYLEAESNELDGVVLIGYGTQNKRSVTGAVSTVSAESIEELNPIKLEQALQGTVSGVNISTQSGSPGAGINIRIRGISTNGNASPTVIIDGYQGDLSVLNPSDIESITVLKDAQAAIYGTIGANGVVLVTTKSGKKNMPVQVEVNASYSIQEIARTLPLLNAYEYGILLNEAFTNANRFPPVSNVSSLGEGTNWQQEIFDQAPILSNNFTLTGGSENISYSFGGSILDQEGIIGQQKSGFDRKTLRSNLNIDLSSKLSLTTAITYTNIGRKTINETGLGSVLFNAVNMPPIYSPFDADGDYTLAPTNLGIEIINPLAQIDNTYNDYVLNKLNGTIGFEYKLLDNLLLTTRIGFNSSYSKGKTFSKEINYGGKVFDITRSQVDQNRINDNDYTYDMFANYDFKIGQNHSLKTTLGMTVFKTFGDGLFATGYEIPNNDWAFADISLADGLAEQKTTGSYIYDQRRLSYFGRVRYDYKEKLLVSALLRRDTSTKFGPNKRIAYFPSFTAGYLLSEESFLQDSSSIDLLKVRVSYGMMGNDLIGDFLYTATLGGEAMYVFNDELVAGRAVGVLPNPNVGWEESEQFDIGIDANFFKNKLSLTADYFIKKTNDLLIEYIPVSGILGTNAPGAGSPTVNAGGVENKGVEFFVSYKDTFWEKLKFNFSYNFTQLENRVTSVNNQVGYIEGGSFGVGQLPPSRMTVGQPIGVFYGYQTDGIFQTQSEISLHPSQLKLGAEAKPGDFRFLDLNGDNIIDDKDRTYLGSPIPDYTMGLNLGFSYENFEFSTYAFASIGNEFVRNYERANTHVNRLHNTILRWRGEGTSDTHPRLTTRSTSNRVFSDYYVEDGSFLRIQNIQIGYNLPSSFMEKQGIEKLRFYFSANNLLTLTNYTGFDPTTNNGQPIGNGIDYGTYPTAKTYLLGMNIKF